MNSSPEHHDQGWPAGPAAIRLVEADARPGPSCQAADGEEPMGGDPPCWAHLFEDEVD